MQNVCWKSGSRDPDPKSYVIIILYCACCTKGVGIMDGEVHRSLISLLVKRSSLKAAILGKGEIRFNTH